MGRHLAVEDSRRNRRFPAPQDRRLLQQRLAVSIVLLASVVVVAVLLWPKAEQPKALERPSAEAPRYMSVMLIDGSTYFGKQVPLADRRFIALDDVYFLLDKTSADGNAHLRPFGGEIHKPLAQMVVPVSAVLYRQPLTVASGAVSAMRSAESTAPPKPSAGPPVLPAGQPEAVFLKTGDVFFGKARVIGEEVVLARAFFLRYKDQGAATSGQIGSLDEVVLVPQESTPMRPSGEMRIPFASVLYLQPLAKDSPVTAAMGK